MADARAAPYRTSARWRLTLSYAAFLLIAGMGTLVGVYVVLRYVPDYPLMPADPSQTNDPATRGEILAAVVRSSLYVLATLLAIGLAGGWWLAGRVLRPLDELHRAARIVAAGDLDHRVRLQGRRDEFAEVADGFDLMLDRLGDAFAAQERFSANAAHELRTPLTVSRTILDVALADPGGAADRQALERLSQTTDRAIGLTEALLRLADVNELTTRHEPIDVADVVQQAASTVGDEAAERGIEIDVASAPTTVAGDPTLLRQLLVNLLQNGVRYNRPGGELSLRVDGDERGARIELQNDGDRLDPERVARFTEPYLRGAGRTAGSGGAPRGHGLGLALVARIVAVHRGRLTLEPRPAGGLRVLVEIPADPGRGGEQAATTHAHWRVARRSAVRADAERVPPKRAPRWLLPVAAITIALGVAAALFVLLWWDGVTFPTP
ncbi:putative two-component system sensor kinase [Patulibacter medicamentivorans]|uniref:histidine kinase n=1 Tax=Patulibacter medicamentivorans TaxID=1097667 RepID=H0E7B7_9ACTN|nr:HAMP domain-containing sensor histidine kinase [Patulibacter medicamentivorans]EHN10442.1 putative two-component system sensor kinase [Patulibacter medicamentivorans]